MHNGSLTAITRTAAQLEREGRYARTRRFYQHGGVTVYAHCVRVAALSCRLADAMGLAVDRAALVRGALLHDYRSEEHTSELQVTNSSPSRMPSSA